MFLQFVLTGIGGILILLACQAIIKRNKIKGEYARKLVHISVAVYAASWALYLPQTVIALIGCLLAISILFVKKLPFLKAVKTVKRVGYGEIFYALGIMISALLFKEPAVYVIAILHMGLADGLAAVIGVGMSKKKNRFRFNGSIKSIEGSLTFIAVSFFLNSSYWVWFADVQINGITPAFVAAYSLIAAMLLATIEIISPKGSDNILVPVTSGLLLLVPAYTAGSIFGII